MTACSLSVRVAFFLQPSCMRQICGYIVNYDILWLWYDFSHTIDTVITALFTEQIKVEIGQLQKCLETKMECENDNLDVFCVTFSVVFCWQYSTVYILLYISKKWNALSPWVSEFLCKTSQCTDITFSIIGNWLNKMHFSLNTWLWFTETSVLMW